MTTSPKGLLNVFEPGLLRGAAKLAFAPHKRYFYVEHPVEGWRVYLRACTFLHNSMEPFDPTKFLVVKQPVNSSKQIRQSNIFSFCINEN